MYAVRSCLVHRMIVLYIKTDVFFTQLIESNIRYRSEGFLKFGRGKAYSGNDLM